jgi:HD-GYP domain-containing protein (c-di-GMP phosphodiesterase class II)
MRILTVSNLSPGAVLAKSIFSANGHPLLKQGVELTASYIAKLAQMGFRHVYIEDSATTDIHDEDSIPADIRQEIVGRIEGLFKKLQMPDGLRSMVKSGKLGREIVSTYRILHTHLMENGTMIVNLSALYSNDAHTYTHCMNVAVISTILGLAHGYPKNVVEQLGMGAMVHDIGKVEISPAILNKPGRLTDHEYAQMKLHTRLGYEMLLKQPDLPESSALCALYHHEWYNGRGYPAGLEGTDIPEFARLMSVADVYDALTANRPYREPMLPSDALELMFTKTFEQFDPIFIKHFMEHVNIYPVGIPVKLSNGTTGVVSKVGEVNLQRPSVLITEDPDSDVLPYEIDLAINLNVTIVGYNL